jgi:hypothetical protein
MKFITYTRERQRLGCDGGGRLQKSLESGTSHRTTRPEGRIRYAEVHSGMFYAGNLRFLRRRSIQSRRGRPTAEKPFERQPRSLRHPTNQQEEQQQTDEARVGTPPFTESAFQDGFDDPNIRLSQPPEQESCTDPEQDPREPRPAGRTASREPKRDQTPEERGQEDAVRNVKGTSEALCDFFPCQSVCDGHDRRAERHGD